MVFLLLYVTRLLGKNAMSVITHLLPNNNILLILPQESRHLGPLSPLCHCHSLDCFFADRQVISSGGCLAQLMLFPLFVTREYLLTAATA